MTSKIYIDYAATTPVRAEVLEQMLPYFGNQFANPSAIYQSARSSKTAIEQARRAIAHSIGAKSNEIFFVSGGTESDNLALTGIAHSYQSQGKHIITTQIEHHAVLDTCRHLEAQGYQVTYLPVDGQGMVDLRELERAIRPDTILISIMAANNEIGTIQPLALIGQLAREKGILFHTDAVQAYTHIDLNVGAMAVDAMTLSAHKIYGPKGVGALYVRNGVKVRALIYGGGQERGRRAGTENVPAIVGFGKAAELGIAEMAVETKRLSELRDYFIDRVEQTIPDVKLNGHRQQRLCQNINFSFAGVDAESLLISLDMNGIFAAGGSACTSGSLDPSHVLQAIGLEPNLLKGAVRFSIGKQTNRVQIEQVVTKLDQLVTNIRSLSARE